MRNKPLKIRILTIREQKDVLDSDLAAVYGVTTKRLNAQFRRNRKRFPEDFAFQLTAEEFESLRSQIATLDEGTQRDETKRIANCDRFPTEHSVSAMGVYRAWCAPSCKCPANGSCHRDERLRDSCVHRAT